MGKVESPPRKVGGRFECENTQRQITAQKRRASVIVGVWVQNRCAVDILSHGGKIWCGELEKVGEV